MKERGLIIENGSTVTVMELNFFGYYNMMMILNSNTNKDCSHSL